MKLVIGKQYTTEYLQDEFIQHGRGAYFDFTGNVDHILSYIEPDVLFRPNMERAIGFNPLRDLEPSTILKALKAAYDFNVSTAIMDTYTLSSLTALKLVPDATLLSVVPLLTNDTYRKKVIGHLKNTHVKSFWQLFEDMSQKDQRQEFFSTYNKFYTFTLDPLLAPIIGQKRTSFTLTKDSTLVASFSPLFGKENSIFLATQLLASLPDMPVVIDGAHMVGWYPDHATVGVKYLKQIPPNTRETVMGSADEIVAFRLGTTDARVLADEFDLGQQDFSLQELPPRHYHLRTQSTTHRLQEFTPLPKREPQSISDERHTRPIEDINEEIRRALRCKSTSSKRKSPKDFSRRKRTTRCT